MIEQNKHLIVGWKMLRTCQTLFPCLDKQHTPIEDVVDPKTWCGGGVGATKRRGRDENLTSGSVTGAALRRRVSGGRPKKNTKQVSILVTAAPLLRSWMQDCTDMEKKSHRKRKRRSGPAGLLLQSAALEPTQIHTASLQTLSASLRIMQVDTDFSDTLD